LKTSICFDKVWGANLMSRRLVILLAPLLLLATVVSLIGADPATTKVRAWESSNGFTIDASFLDKIIVNEEIHYRLKRADGKVITIGKKLLSLDSQKVAATLGAHIKSPKMFLNGTVVGVTDGDTITLLDSNKKQYKVRLEGIDAPESNQAFGTQAKKRLSELIFGKSVQIISSGKGKYQRHLGDIYLNDRWINKTLIEEGLAWHYDQYSDSKELAAAHAKAKASGKGLWTDEKVTAPWDFRHGTKPATEPTPASLKPTPAAEFTATPGAIYITKTGKKYHLGTCRFLTKSKIPASLNQVARTHGPCSVCKPPVLRIAAPQPGANLSHWITSSSGVRHNRGCRYYRNSNGRPCSATTGRACKICGG
jgi:endonuclease YncB( thermonuclease family)